jgi:predicted short-subunit dehydrogenase-like oxidoreductase (DUF2520 family)
MPEVFIIGPGRVGKTLALRHKQMGDPVCLFGRQSGDWQQWAKENQIKPLIGSIELPHNASLIFCVQDDELSVSIEEWRLSIQAAVSSLNNSESGDLLLVHTSGFHGLDIFEIPSDHLSSQICLAALHPVLNFGSPEETLQRLSRSAITALTLGENSTAQKLVKTWGGDWLPMDSNVDRHQYHLALSLAANHLTELISRAVHHLHPSLGDHAPRLVYQLAAAALDACKQSSPENALTGPVIRGDLATLQAHFHALPQEEKPLHLMEVQALLKLANRSGRLSQVQSEAISDWLKKALGSLDS